jgi:hypothetical protein
MGDHFGILSSFDCNLKFFYRYDPHLNKWTLIASMSHRRAGAGVVVLDGCLYALGGFDDNSPLNTCERYRIFLVLRRN